MMVTSRRLVGYALAFAGWLLVFGGLFLGGANACGPIVYHEAWSDRATAWMLPTSAAGVVAGLAVIFLAIRLVERKPLG